MRYIFPLILSICFVSLAGEPRAESVTDAYSRQFADCMDGVDSGFLKNSQWLKCFESEFARQSQGLENEYKMLTSRLSPDVRRRVQRSKTSWMVFRADWCKVDAEFNKAPTPRINEVICLIDSTIEYAARLRKMIK
jgi:hypothetical protein